MVVAYKEADYKCVRQMWNARKVVVHTEAVHMVVVHMEVVHMAVVHMKGHNFLAYKGVVGMVVQNLLDEDIQMEVGGMVVVSTVGQMVVNQTVDESGDLMDGIPTLLYRFYLYQIVVLVL